MARRRRRGLGVASAGRVLVALVLLGVIAGAVGLQLLQRGRIEAVDPDTYCERSGARALTVIAIDTSDPFDAVQVREIDLRVRRLLGRLERGDRVDIFMMNAPRGGLSERLFSMCNPGRATRLDQIAGQPSRVEQRYREQFADALQEALRTAIERPATPTSPLVESVRAVAADSLGDVPDDARRRLIVVSDLVQHSDIMSFYRARRITPFESFSASPGYARAQTDLRGASVDLVVILRERDAAYQTRELLLWWEAYIRANNGRVDTFERI